MEIRIDAASQDDARAQVTEMCRKLLANPVIEDYRFEVEELVTVFPNMNREELRTTFDRVAELYDARRPTHPPQLFDDLVALRRFRRRARARGRLRDRPGDAADGGARVRDHRGRAGREPRGGRAAEPRAVPAASMCTNADFEQWALPAEPFDLVMSVQRVALARP